MQNTENRKKRGQIDNYLEVIGVGKIDFADATQWTKVDDANGDSTYTATTNLSDIVTLHVENIIYVDNN